MYGKYSTNCHATYIGLFGHIKKIGYLSLARKVKKILITVLKYNLVEQVTINITKCV